MFSPPGIDIGLSVSSVSIDTAVDAAILVAAVGTSAVLVVAAAAIVVADLTIPIPDLFTFARAAGCSGTLGGGCDGGGPRAGAIIRSGLLCAARRRSAGAIGGALLGTEGTLVVWMASGCDLDCD